MPSNYPEYIDNISNPADADDLDTPSHSGIHTNLNDAIVAVQETLGTDPQGAFSTVEDRMDWMHSKITANP